MINYNLLVADSTLQDLLIDKSTGLPLVNGILTFWQDNNRTTLKNVYSLSGQPGAYTYNLLPNPLTLSAIGTVMDNNGNDTKLFYYPVSEVDNSTAQLYYVTVDNMNGQRQFVRQDWPPASGSGGVLPPGATGFTNKNYIANNVFWRNAGTVVLNASNALTSAIIAPSQHDGFRMPEIQFIKNTSDATDTITFEQFANSSNQQLTNDPTPEFYVNVQTTVAGTATSKYIQFPIALHVENLAGYVGACCTIQSMNNGGVASAIGVSLLQDLGTGVTSPAAIPLQTINLTPGWTKTTIPFSFPTVTPGNLSTAGDDGWYLQITFPAAADLNINIAKPSVYLAPSGPNNDFDNYDQVNTIISSPRTADVRTSLNDYYPWGWVPMSNGTIGNATSNATARANIDTWKLFNLLWNKFNVYSTGNSTSSGTNPIAQMYTSAGVAVGYGPGVSTPTTAIGDWNANKAIALTKAMGQVILGTVPIAALLSATPTIPGYSSAFVATSNVITPATSNILSFFNGMPVIFSGTTTLSTSVIYYVTAFNGSTFSLSTTFAQAITGAPNVTVASDSGTVKGALTGTSEGEYAHTQLPAELAVHNHTIPALSGNVVYDPTPGNTVYRFTGAGSGTGIVVTSAATTTGSTPLFVTTGAGATGNSSGGTAFNVTQPGTFYNIYMKL